VNLRYQNPRIWNEYLDWCIRHGVPEAEQDRDETKERYEAEELPRLCGFTGPLPRSSGRCEHYLLDLRRPEVMEDYREFCRKNGIPEQDAPSAGERYRFEREYICRKVGGHEGL